MKKINTILVPIDFSEVAENAYRYALSFAEVIGAKIEVLHVYRPDINAYIQDPIVLEELRKTTQQRLLRFIEKPGLVSVEGRLEIGFPANTIEEISEGKEIDLIIMGTKGEHNLAEKIFGSVTSRVMKGVEKPVLVIPEGIRYQPIDNIAFASDSREREPFLLRRLSDIAYKFDAALHCVHINTEDSTYYIADQLFKALEDVESPSLIMTYSELTSNSVKEGLLKFIENYEIDLLVMYTNHKSMWERLFKISQTRKMAFQTPIPLLVFNQK